MTKIEMPKMLTFDEIIQQCSEWCAESGKKASEIVTDEVLNLVTQETLRRLAAKGLMYEVNNRMHYDRDDIVGAQDNYNTHSAEERSKRSGMGVTQGRNPNAAGVGSAKSPLDILMLGAGEVKKLRDFNLKDVEACGATCSATALGWQRRADWFSTVADTLKETGAKTVGKIAKKRLSALEESARQAWGGK